MKIFTYLFAIVLLILGFSFSLLNSSEVTINYFLGSATLSESILVIFSVAIGAIISLFFCMLSILCNKAKIYHLERKIESLEKAVQSTSSLAKS